MRVEAYELDPEAFAVLRDSLQAVPFATLDLESAWTAAEIDRLAASLRRLQDASPGGPSWLGERLDRLAAGTMWRDSLSGGGGWGGSGSHPWRFNMDVNQLSAGCVDRFLDVHGLPPEAACRVIEVDASRDRTLAALCRLRFSLPVLAPPIAPEALLQDRALIQRSLVVFGGNHVSSDRFLVCSGAGSAPWPEALPEGAVQPWAVAAALGRDHVPEPAFPARVAACDQAASRLAAELARCRARGSVLAVRTRDNRDYE